MGIETKMIFQLLSSQSHFISAPFFLCMSVNCHYYLVSSNEAN